ncbi:MAG: 50S ribosomal protein L9 [Patescibacteria group bacterium]
MRVIFLQDVPRVGRRFDVKDVNDGYAMNFLLPRRLAEVASEKNLKELEERKKQIIVEKEIQEELLEKNLEELSGKVVNMKAKADEKGHLFSGIHKKEIVEALGKMYIEIKEELIDLEKPLKTLGEFEIPVKVANKKSSFKLVIEKSEE